MIQQKNYEALVEKVADLLHKMWADSDMTCARAALAVIAQELQVPSENMLDAGLKTDCWAPAEIWRAMLAASPLNPETKP